MEYLIYIIEIIMIYAGLAAIYGFLKGSTGDSAVKGMAVVVGGMLIGFYIIATNFNLYRIELLLGKLLDYLLFALIVIFQPELRRGIVRLGQHRLFQRFAQGRSDTIDRLAQAVFHLANEKTGALIVVERGVGLNNYAERGTVVDARITPELLATIFHKGGPLHDGAVILRGSRIVAAEVLLPLTENITLSKRLGTRHRAGIGITEDSDAISIIVSEETGRVSIAVRGELSQNLSREEFEGRLRDALQDAAPGIPEPQASGEVGA